MYNIKPSRAGGRMRCPPVGILKEISGETFRSEFDAIYLTGKTRGSSITTARTIMGGRRVKQPMNFTERRFTSIERRFLSLNVGNLFRILGEEIIIRTSLVDFSNFFRKLPCAYQRHRRNRNDKVELGVYYIKKTAT
jgi:hypothetical protein